MRWLTLLPAALAAGAVAAGASEPVVALLALPALLVMPGLGLARRYARDPLTRAGLTFWASAVLTVPAVLVGAWTGLDGLGALATAATITAVTSALPARPGGRLGVPARLGALAVGAVVLFVGLSWRDAVLRPLDRHWWYPDAEAAWADGAVTVPPTLGAGWAEHRSVGWDDAHALRLVPRDHAPYLLGPGEGPLVVAVRAPLGASIEVGGRTAVVTADVTVKPEEGPVARYLERGVAAVTVPLDLAAGERLPIRLSDPARSIVYVLGSGEAVWSLHATGELRFVHYYQLLNMVEQIRWSRELYGARRVTDVQPPLPSYVLAAVAGVTDGELPTANLLFLLELVFVGLAGLAVLEAWAPRAPLLAWLLPAAAVAEHAKLLLEASSGMLPDTLYTLGVLGMIAGLTRPGLGYEAHALLAQLTRYSTGYLAITVGLLAGEPRRVVRMLCTVAATAGVIAVGGAVTGRLEGWVATVWWEIGPEHWHGEHDPSVLLPRAPEFFRLWVLYAGGLPLLAALRWPRATRVLLGTAVLYAGLLCTIDHSPSHYFLPLVHLAALAAAATAAEFARPGLRLAIPLVGLMGIFAAYLWVPIVG